MNNIIHRLEPGTRIAICGSVGSGKTTVMNRIRELIPNGDYMDDYDRMDEIAFLDERKIQVYCIQSLSTTMRRNIDFWIFTSRRIFQRFINSRRSDFNGEERERADIIMDTFDEPHQLVYYDARTREFLN
jgi:ABC-type glutathione transport system ATPase component